MTKLSLNKAAKEASVAKSTLLDAIRAGDLTAPKNRKGHYEIDPAELFRVFPKTSFEEPQEPNPTPQENQQNPLDSSVIQVEVKMLREQIERMDTDRGQERDQLTDQIENLRSQIERQSADHRQALAALTDQRERASEPPRKGLWARLRG